jgi:hypothetical protein
MSYLAIVRRIRQLECASESATRRITLDEIRELESLIVQAEEYSYPGDVTPDFFSEHTWMLAYKYKRLA